MKSEKFVIVVLILVVSFIAIWSVIQPLIKTNSNLGITGRAIFNPNEMDISQDRQPSQNPNPTINNQMTADSKESEPNKEYRFRCTQNCDRGLSIYDQASYIDPPNGKDYIAIQLQNNNPRQCDMYCSVWNGEVSIKSDDYDKPNKLRILYDTREGYSIESDTIKDLNLVCQEGGRDGSNYQVAGCEVVIKQVFTMEEIP